MATVPPAALVAVKRIAALVDGQVVAAQVMRHRRPP